MLLGIIARKEARVDQRLFRGKGAGLGYPHANTCGLRSALGREVGDINSPLRMETPSSSTL